MNKKLTFFIIVFVVNILHSDENHFINVFVGDRAAGLGGAYTAIADGPEGVFYNPAGLAFSSSKYFSLSVNAIQFKMLYYKDVYKRANGKPFDYARYSLSFIPNFFGFIQKQKKFTFAITVSCPDSEFYDQRDNAVINLYDSNGTALPTNLNVNFNYTNMIYELGPSFAFLLHKRVALGFNVFLRYRDVKVVSQTTYKLKDNDSYFQTGSIYTNNRIFGFNFQLGLQFMPIDKLSIGYSISTPFDFVNISSDQTTNMYEMLQYDINQQVWFGSTRGVSVTNNEYKTYNIAENGLFRPLFIKQALGIGVFLNKSMMLTCDGYLYIPIQHKNSSGKLVSYQYNSKKLKYDETVLSNNELLNIIGNVALGYEWFITPNFPFRVGFFTNFSNTQEIKKGNMNRDDNVHLIGGSLSLGFATSDLSINFGAVVSGGGGKAQIIGDNKAIQDLIAVSAVLFMSGGYQF